MARAQAAAALAMGALTAHPPPLRSLSGRFNAAKDVPLTTVTPRGRGLDGAGESQPSARSGLPESTRYTGISVVGESTLSAREYKPADAEEVSRFPKLQVALQYYESLASLIQQHITSHTWFMLLIFSCIVFAAVLVGIDTYSKTLPSSAVSTVRDLDTAMTAVFVIEIALRLIAEGRTPLHFFRDRWNTFDFCVVLAAFAPISQQQQSMVRLVRLLRVLKVIRQLPALRVLVVSLLKSISGLTYVGLLAMLTLYMSAVMATSMFGANDPSNFGSLHRSMFSLFRVATSEDWTDIMEIELYGCDQSGYGPVFFAGAGLGAEAIDGWEGVCTQPQAKPLQAVAFFVLFVFATTFILLNLLVSMIITSVAQVNSEFAQGTQLLVQVMRARDLVAADAFARSSDPFVTVSVGSESHSTRVKKRTLNPRWANAVFEFVPLEALGSVCELEVFDWNRFGRADSLGKCAINVTELPYHSPVHMELPLEGAESGTLVISVVKGLDMRTVDVSALDREDRMVAHGTQALELWKDTVAQLKDMMRRRRKLRKSAMLGSTAKPAARLAAATTALYSVVEHNARIALRLRAVLETRVHKASATHDASSPRVGASGLGSSADSL